MGRTGPRCDESDIIHPFERHGSDLYTVVPIHRALSGRTTDASGAPDTDGHPDLGDAGSMEEALAANDVSVPVPSVLSISTA